MPATCTPSRRLQPVAADRPARPPSRRPRSVANALTVADLAVASRMRAAMIVATDQVLPALAAAGRGPDYWWCAARRKEEGPRPLDTVGQDLVRLANAGATEAELRAIPRALDALLDDLYPAAVRRTLDELDVEEAELEGREDLLHARRRCGLETPALLREEAAVNRAEARVQEERARVLEARARHIESGRPLPVTREPETAPDTRTPDHEGRASAHRNNHCAEWGALQRGPVRKVTPPTPTAASLRP